MPPACFPLRFFHVPKAASSFAPFVWAHTCDLPLSMLQLKREESVLRDRTNLSWAQQPDNLRRCRCYMRGPGHSGRPRLFSDYHHAPLRSATEAQHAAGLFRQPLARLVSNARYDLDYRWNRSTVEQRLEAYVQRRHLRAKGAGRRGRLRRVRELRAFVRSERDEELLEIGKRQIGVAANMLIGREPNSHNRLPLIESEKMEAVRRVEAMAFVGLIECFNESVTLFQRRFTGALHVPTQTYRVTPSNRRQIRRDRALLQSNFSDPADELVYATAARLFHRRRAEAGIPVASAACATTEREENTEP